MSKRQRAATEFAQADRLETGDPIPPFTLPDIHGHPVNPASDHLAGRPLVLTFACDGRGDATWREELRAMADRKSELDAAAALALVISRQDCEANRAQAEEAALPFPLLSDSKSALYAACGLDPQTVGRAAVTLVLDGNLRLVGLTDGGCASRWSKISAMLASVTAAQDCEPLTSQAPVLVLPRVLSAADCRRLIEVWHRPMPEWEAQNYATTGFQETEGDFKVLNKDYGTLVQMVVRDGEVQRYLDAKLQRRVMPQIAKAFQTKVSRREDYRIACYDADNDGWLGPHRDNPTKQTRHRRFTLAVTLNAEDFDGGGLCFREYSDRPYLVPTGSAIVWSCALLHEVAPITAGRRFILGTHLFGN
jgi:peroxiredoxin/predicted 2-oxoglutarate/Fe(II)-dependent dioxygenase YbiX